MIIFFKILLFLGFAEDEITLEADQITYDNESVIADGSVNVDYSNYNLKSKSLVYYVALKKIEANNAKIKTLSGEEIVTSYALLSSDFKNISTKNITVYLKDKSVFSAKESNKTEDKSYFKNASYTACKFCKQKAPLWSIKSDEITHTDETISYKNSFLYIKKTPVFYLPYFWHPDPSVKQKMGLLAPSFGFNKDLGMMTRTPVYMPINRYSDLTVTPILVTRQNPVLITEYRKNFLKGNLFLCTSYTKTNHLFESLQTKDNVTSHRYHINGIVNHEVSDQTRIFIDINKASDTAYLVRYPIKSSAPSFTVNRNLTSHAFIEKGDENFYNAIHTYYFQTDDQNITPVILPKISASRNDKLPIGFLETSFDFLSLQRKENDLIHAKGMNRGAIKANWMDVIVIKGHKITSSLSSRIDAYSINNYLDKNKNTVRFAPNASIEWSYPLLAKSILIEPKGMLIAAPYDSKRKHIPNEDCHNFVFDDTSIFLPNRYLGIDRFDEGKRGVYGVSVASIDGVNLFLGKDTRIDKKQSIHPSNYIALLSAKIAKDIHFRHKISIDKRLKNPSYAESGVSIGPKILSVDLSHVYSNNLDLKKPISQISTELKSQFHEYWGSSIATIINVKGSNVANFLSLNYQDECFVMRFGVYRNFQKIKDIRPDTGFLLQFTLRNLGNIGILNTSTYPGSPLTRF